MKCTNCGQELMEDSEFCVFCGTKVTGEASSQPAEEQQPAEQTAEQPVEQPTEKPVEKSTEQPAAQTPVPAPATEKKPFNWAVPVLGVGAILLIALVAVILVNVLGVFSSDTSKMAVYVKGDELLYVKNVEKVKEPMVICEIRGDKEYDYEGAYGLQLSADNKYLYFYDRVESAGTGDLCRIKISQIGKNQDKNEKKIQEIDSGVVSYTLLGDSQDLIYKKDNGKLIYYKGEKEIDIDREVESYSMDFERQVVTYTKSEQGKTELYVYDLKEDDSEKIDSGLDYVSYMYDADLLVYSKTGEGAESSSIYVADADGNREKLGDSIDIAGYDSSTKRIYYVERVNKSESLYSHVNDVYAESDAKLTEPEPKNYLSEVTEKDAIQDEEYQYYIVENPEYRSDFYEWLGYDDDMQMYYYYNYDRYQSEDIVEHYFYNELENKWYFYDENTYQKDCENYYSVADRIELRNQLKAENYEWTEYNLYCSEGGKEGTLIAENVDFTTLQLDAYQQVIVYGRKTMDNVTVSLDEIGGTYDVRERLDDVFYNETVEKEFYYIIAGQKEQKLDMTLNTERGAKAINVSEDGKTAMVLSDYKDGDYTLTAYKIQDGTLEEIDEVSDNVYGGDWIDGTYYYYKDVDTSSNIGDICYYKDGKGESLVKNVCADKACFMDDGNFMVYGDYSYEDGGELELCNSKGDKTRVANRATSYSYIEKDCILFMKDEDLHVFNGKEDNRVDRNVLTYICDEEYGDYLY